MKPGLVSAAGQGLSLIELLVSLAIGLVVTIAMTSALIRNESSRRTTASASDLNKTGSSAAFILDRAIRNGGSGFSQNWASVFGCRLDILRGDSLLLPATLQPSSAFANLKATAMNVRLAPVIIGKGLADMRTDTRGDVLMVMSGTAGMSESASIVSSISGNVLVLPNTLGYRAGDLILLAHDPAGGDCTVQQVGAVEASSASITLSGKYHAGPGANVDPRAFAARSIAFQLGSEDYPPQLRWFGVGAGQTLFSYDLLKSAADGPESPIAEGVVEMRALYGVQTGSSPAGTADVWVDPSGPEYSFDILTGGSAEARLSLRKLVAIKVGLVLRAPLHDQPEHRHDETVTLFGDVRGAGDVSLAYTRKISGTDLGYRYRTVEFTIPLRNVLMAPPS